LARALVGETRVSGLASVRESVVMAASAQVRALVETAAALEPEWAQELAAADQARLRVWVAMRAALGPVSALEEPVQAEAQVSGRRGLAVLVRVSASEAGRREEGLVPRLTMSAMPA
jgi:hypothetical protein